MILLMLWGYSMVQKIKKYKNKILSFLVAVVALPFLTVNSFAFTIPLDSVVVKPDAGNEIEFQLVTDNGTKYIDAVYDSGEYSTEFHTAGLDTNVSILTYKLHSSEFTYSYNYEAYDYYFAINYFFNNENSYFNCDDIRVATYNENDVYIYSQLTNMSYDNTTMHVNDIYYKVFSAIGKLPSSYGQHSVQRIYVRGDGYVGNADYNECTCYLYQVPKNTSTEEVNALITAINNQTNQLSSDLGSIDNSIIQGNEIAENGNDTTQENVTEFTEVFEDFNAELDEIESFDDEIIGEFEAANTEYLTTLNNFELTHSVLNAGNWLATSMQTIYDSSSDYKMLWLVPMIFGIPILLFIGKKIKGDDE